MLSGNRARTTTTTIHQTAGAVVRASRAVMPSAATTPVAIRQSSPTMNSYQNRQTAPIHRITAGSYRASLTGGRRNSAGAPKTPEHPEGGKQHSDNKLHEILGTQVRGARPRQSSAPRLRTPKTQRRTMLTSSIPPSTVASSDCRRVLVSKPGGSKRNGTKGTAAKGNNPQSTQAAGFRRPDQCPEQRRSGGRYHPLGGFCMPSARPLQNGPANSVIAVASNPLSSTDITECRPSSTHPIPNRSCR